MIELDNERSAALLGNGLSKVSSLRSMASVET